jgi:hypothetical protein
MKRNFLISLLIIILLTSSCGLLAPPAPAPQLSATDLPPKATALSELPPTWTPEPTLTPSITPPPSPTFTATQDPDAYKIGIVMTPVAVEYPISDLDITNWKVIEGKTASISVPPSFEELDFAGVFTEMMVGMMEALTEGFMKMAESVGEELGVTPEATLEKPDLGEMPDFDFILAMEESSQSAIVLASVDREPETTTESLINQALSGTDTDFQPLSRELFANAPYTMERVIMDVEDQDLGPSKQVLYVILTDEMAWNLIFTAPQGVYPEYLPLFEAVLNSFTPAN